MVQDTPLIVSLGRALMGNVSPAPTPVAHNVPCQHRPTILCQVPQLPTLEAPAAGSCIWVIGAHAGQLLRHLGGCLFQLVEVVISRARDIISTAMDV